MQLSAAIAPIWELRHAFIHGVIPTILHILNNPLLIFSPSALWQYYFSCVWLVYGPGSDEGSKDIKTDLLSTASGVVLELGAGHGRTMYYLDKDKVTKYIALEPNTDMHPLIREHAVKAGFDEAKGEVQILSCGAGDLGTITSALGGEGQIDTLVSIITLCSVPNAKEVISSLCTRALKPGGQFLFYEHVLSRRSDVQWWQHAWNPVWRVFFDGCNLDQPTDLWIKSLGIWDDSLSETWGKKGEPEENIWWHQMGRVIKRKNLV